MGRPLNDKFFAPTSPGPGAKPGKQIRLTLASFTDGPDDVSNTWIIRQRSTSRFEVTDGSNVEVLEMFNGSGSVPRGRCALKVTPLESETEFARTFTAHQVKTFQGNTYIWSHLQEGIAASQPDEVDFDPTMV